MERAFEKDGRAIMNVNEELLRYLQAGNFESFMLCWKHQVERLGRVGGSISLVLNDENRSDVSGFMGIDYHKQSHAKISWSTLKKAILNSRFENADFEMCLRLYFNTEIISQKTHKERKQQQVEELLSTIEKEYEQTKAAAWLAYVIMEDGSVYSRMKQEIQLHPSVFKKQVIWVMKAIEELPIWKQENENMAIFASRITLDPHAFDLGTTTHYFLMHAVCYHLHIEYRKMNNLEKNEVMYQAGLYRDSVSNFCVIAHINAFEDIQRHHSAWNGFYEHFESWNVNTQNLKAICTIDSSSCKVVVVVENPSVFQELVEHAKVHKMINIGFLCTNGQLNFSGYLLMDMIHQSGIMMMYSGDMDPEGLLIADKLKQRYTKGLELWRYSRTDYEVAASKKYADKKRLAMLELIQNEELQLIGTYLNDEPIGYQENLMVEYKLDLESFAYQ